MVILLGFPAMPPSARPSLKASSLISEAPLHNFALSIQAEYELRFFLPLDTLQNHLSLKDHNFEIIAQSYFPKTTLPLLHSLAIQLGQPEDQETLNSAKALSPRSGRLRVTQSGIHRKYCIQLKGARDLAGTRNELQLVIPEELFLLLRSQASEGTLEKRRYRIPGSLHLPKKGKLSSQVEVDVFGESDPRFAIAEWELDCPTFSAAVAQKSHSFRVLDGALELRDVPRELRKAVSNRNIARIGVEHRIVKEAVAELGKLARRQ